MDLSVCFQFPFQGGLFSTLGTVEDTDSVAHFGRKSGQGMTSFFLSSLQRGPYLGLEVAFSRFATVFSSYILTLTNFLLKVFNCGSILQLVQFSFMVGGHKFAVLTKELMQLSFIFLVQRYLAPHLFLFRIFHVYHLSKDLLTITNTVYGFELSLVYIYKN